MPESPDAILRPVLRRRSDEIIGMALSGLKNLRLFSFRFWNLYLVWLLSPFNCTWYNGRNLPHSPVPLCVHLSCAEKRTTIF